MYIHLMKSISIAVNKVDTDVCQHKTKLCTQIHFWNRFFSQWLWIILTSFESESAWKLTEMQWEIDLTSLYLSEAIAVNSLNPKDFSHLQWIVNSAYLNKKVARLFRKKTRLEWWSSAASTFRGMNNLKSHRTLLDGILCVRTRSGI